MCKGTKNVPKSQNEVHKDPIVMGAKCYNLWQWHVMVLNCSVCLSWMALCGLVWPYVAQYVFIAFVWPSVFLHGHLWPSYGFLLHFMVFYGRVSPFLAVIDPNSFGLVLFFHSMDLNHLFILPIDMTSSLIQMVIVFHFTVRWESKLKRLICQYIITMDIIFWIFPANMKMDF